MIRELMSSRRFAPLFWAQFFSALNDNVLKNALVIILLYSAATGHGDALVTVAGAVFIFPYFILSGLGGQLADKYVKSVVARRLKFAEIFAAGFAAAGFFLHSVPPTTSLTSAGKSDSTTAPTSQNQETMMVPSHSRLSA